MAVRLSSGDHKLFVVYRETWRGPSGCARAPPTDINLQRRRDSVPEIPCCATLRSVQRGSRATGIAIKALLSENLFLRRVEAAGIGRIGAGIVERQRKDEDGCSGANGNRGVEAHYRSTGFAYTITENFMDLFDGLSYTQADMFLAEALQDQGNSYWSMMHANPYKYGFSGSIGNSYYNFSQLYDLNEYALRLDGGRRPWDNSVPSSSVEPPQLVPDGPGEAEASNTSYTDERIRTSSSTSSPQQYVWQDNIDPDSMTYEELLDLGEAVGTQSRGLSQEHISSLPVKKYKCSFFSRKKKQKDRCVICQMEYKRGERQMTLPCQHVYHSECVSTWLTLNKACPVCAAEVPSGKK